MNVLWHQVRKDLRFVRWPLVLWAAVLGVATLLEASTVDRYVPDRAESITILHAVLVFAAALLSWLITARIVHADPLDGTTAFWLTRPIAPRTLYLSKLGLILALFALVPPALLSLGALANGVLGLDALRVGLESALVHAVFVLAVVLLASLTRDVARLVLAAVVVSIAWVSVFTLARLGELAFAEPLADSALAFLSGMLVAGPVFIVAAGALIAHQYLTRRTRRSAVAAACVAAAAIPVVTLWPWNILLARQPVDPRAFDQTPVTVSLDIEREHQGDSSARAKRVLGRFRAASLPPGWEALPLAIESRLTFRGGPAITSRERAWFGRSSDYTLAGLSEQTMAAIAHAAGGRWLNDPWSEADVSARRLPSGLPVVVATVPRQAFLRHRGSEVTLEATLTLAAIEARAAAATKLGAGATARVGSLETTVLAVRREDDPRFGPQLSVSVRATRPQYLFPRPTPALAYVLRNQPRGEIVFGLPSLSRFPYTFFTGACLRLLHGEIWFRRTVDSAPIPLNDRWLKDAELVLITLEEKGTFTKTVRVPNLVLGEAARVPAP